MAQDVESVQRDFESFGEKMKLNLNKESSVDKISTPVNCRSDSVPACRKIERFFVVQESSYKCGKIKNPKNIK